MEVINKLYSSVSSTVSQLSLSSVYPGNPIFREYEVGAQLASAGPGKFSKLQIPSATLLFYIFHLLSLVILFLYCNL